MEVLENAMPEILNEDQKSKKVSNLLQAMKREGLVEAEGKHDMQNGYCSRRDNRGGLATREKYLHQHA